jgi:hypothetical protein
MVMISRRDGHFVDLLFRMRRSRMSLAPQLDLNRCADRIINEDLVALRILNGHRVMAGSRP